MPLEFDKVQATAPLVDMADAKAHLRIRDADHDAEIALKLAHATDVILDYLKSGADPEWTAATVPKPVQAAVLIMLTHLYEHRGEDMTPSGAGGTPDADVWAAVDRLLARFRDPAVA
jgi:Phage gp6-like head-tail connector protein